MSPAVPIVIGGIALVVVLVAALYSAYYTKVPPDDVAVFTGRRGFRIVRGGASFRLPVIERVDFMSLTPFETPLPIRGAYSKEGVPVNVDAVALVRFDSSDEAVRTAAERFLNVERKSLQGSIQEILSGHLRSICAKMTVEELNSAREILVSKVTEEAGSDFAGIGMNLDVLTIQHISDDQGYLENLGRKRVAEIKRDAEVGEAEAARDSAIKSAEALRIGETAKAEADAAIAEANRDRDLRIAKARADVEAERARAEQAGPLADAEARRNVTKAQVAIEEERTRANIAVEQQEVLRQQQALEASVVKPAEADRRAAIVRAEGDRQATIERAEGNARATALEGEGQAQSRRALADAHQRELAAQGTGEAEGRKANAEALLAELQAQGEGQKAVLLGEADGKRQLAEALNAYNEAAFQLTVYPELIRKLPDIAGSLAAPFAQVDRIVMLDSGSGNGGGPLGKYGSTVPMMLAQAIETLRAVGLDIPGMLGARGSGEDGGPPPAGGEPAKQAASEAASAADKDNEPSPDSKGAS